MENLTQLLINECQSTVITLNQFKIFNSRFGPLSQCITKVRDFVNAGATWWYHGYINRVEAETRLKKFFRERNTSCYLLRAAQPPILRDSHRTDQHYIFAASFLNWDGRPRHMRLYANRLNQLVQCIPLDNGYFEKPVKNFMELFQGLGQPVIPYQSLMLRMEIIPAVPDKNPDDPQENYISFQ